MRQGLRVVLWVCSAVLLIGCGGSDRPLRQYETPEDWVQALIDPTTSGETKRAVRAMEEGAVPVLVQCLKQTDDDLRWWAAMQLSRIGESASEAAPDLLRIIEEDESSAVRVAALVALYSMHFSRESTSILLRTFTEDENLLARVGASEFLDSLDPLVSQTLGRVLREREDPADRLLAVMTMTDGLWLTSDRLGDLLLAMREDPNPCVRSAAARGLASQVQGLWSQAPDAAEIVLATLVWVLSEDEDPRVRLEATMAIKELLCHREMLTGQRYPRLGGDLYEALAAEEDPLVRVGIAKAIWESSTPPYRPDR